MTFDCNDRDDRDDRRCKRKARPTPLESESCGATFQDDAEDAEHSEGLVDRVMGHLGLAMPSSYSWVGDL